MAEVRWTPQASDDLEATTNFVELLTVYHGARLLDPSRLT